MKIKEVEKNIMCEGSYIPLHVFLKVKNQNNKLKISSSHLLYE